MHRKYVVAITVYCAEAIGCKVLIFVQTLEIVGFFIVFLRYL